MVTSFVKDTLLVEGSLVVVVEVNSVDHENKQPCWENQSGWPDGFEMVNQREHRRLVAHVLVDNSEHALKDVNVMKHQIDLVQKEARVLEPYVVEHR